MALPNILSIAKKSLIGARLSLLDCQRGDIVEISDFPARLGRVDNAVWTPMSLAPGQPGCLIETVDGVLTLVPESPGLVTVNGMLLNNVCELPSSGIVFVQIGRELAALGIGEDALMQLRKAQADDWRLVRAADGQVEGITRLRELPTLARQRGLDPQLYQAAPLGLEGGFPLPQIFSVLGTTARETPVLGELPILGGTRGAYICPVCWQRFDAGDAMNIAAHESLRGDPVLGVDARLRFFPTRFNELGQAIDPMGLPSSDLACPHCRRRLPPGFLDVPQLIFSIVGAPSAGKSYYLSILLKILQQKFFSDFGLVLKDGDPTGNVLLNQMKNRLFSAALPEDAVLAKTALEGAMYERFPRFGKMVSLPRPFAYSIGRVADEPKPAAGSSNGSAEHSVECCLIFYDNAGEHFEPGVDVDDSPGALHVASSSTIFFLFDPTANFGFRKLLTNSPDPQISQTTRLDQQDSIMAEMEVRVKRVLALEPSRKLDIPLAVILGKCDVWKHLVKWDEIKYPLRDGKVDHAIVDANSALLREFMIRVDPAIVAHAEGLARTVRYFAVSAFGHTPNKIATGPSAGLIAPDPKRISPIDIEIPTLWALSRLVPALVPRA